MAKTIVIEGVTWTFDEYDGKIWLRAKSGVIYIVNVMTKEQLSTLADAMKIMAA